MHTSHHPHGELPGEPLTERCVAVLTEHYLHCLEFKGRSPRWRWFSVESRSAAE
jgi:hypothetical protein